MVAFEDLFALPTLSGVKSALLQLALTVVPPLPVTSWQLGQPTERWTDITPRLVHRLLSVDTTLAIRGFFLDLATDPGDPGDLSADQTPRPGWLSALGFSWYGVKRGGDTYATGSITITNAGDSPATFAPFDLTFHRSVLAANGGQPSYRNSEDPSIYTGLGGTLTLAAGASATIPIIAEQLGSYGTASAGEISIVVTQSFGTLTGSNAGAAIGTDREDRLLYIGRCRAAAAKLSHGGPGAAYRLNANTARDGTPLQRFDGSGEVGITRVYVSADSTTGRVFVYFADPDGPADAIDLSSANANITGIVLGVITDPVGVVPDAVTIGPTTIDTHTGGPGGAAAIAVDVQLAGTAKLRRQLGGLSGVALIAAAQAAILTEMSVVQFPSYPIGGYDQVSGAGFLYRRDIEDDIRDAYAGLSNVNLTVPATTTVALAQGRVGRLVSPPAITNAVTSGGLIKITTASAHGRSTGDQVQIYGVLGTIEANGTWTITEIDETNFTLDASAFVNAYVSGGAFSRLILTVVSA